MRSLQGFSDAATPVFDDLGRAAPVADRSDPDADPVLGRLDRRAEGARRRRRSRRARTSREADPVVQQGARPGQVRRRARRPNWPSSSSALKKTEGLRRPGRPDLQRRPRATNGFDKYGHFVRTPGDARRTASNTHRAEASGCSANFTGPNAGEASAIDQRRRSSRRIQEADGRAERRHRSAAHRPGRAPAVAPLGDARPRPSAASSAKAEAARRQRRPPPAPAARPPRLPPGPMREPQRNTGSGEQPGPGRGGHRAGRHRRRLPRLQRQQRPALRLHLQPQGAGAQRRRAGQGQRGADRRRPGRRRQVGGAGPARRRRASPPNSTSASTRAPNRCRSTRR